MDPLIPFSGWVRTEWEGKIQNKTKQIEFEDGRQTTWFQEAPPKPDCNMLLVWLLVLLWQNSCQMPPWKVSELLCVARSTAVGGRDAYEWTSGLVLLVPVSLGHDILIIHATVRLGQLYFPSVFSRTLKGSDEQVNMRMLCRQEKVTLMKLLTLWTLVWVCVLRLMISYFC